MGSQSRPDGFTVLHVDGSADVRARAAAALDADVTGVETAAAARDALADGDFDCVVSEYALPDVDAADGGALALCEHVAAVAPDAAFVFYTDAGDESVAGRAVAAGADGYVPKADGLDVLVDRVLEAVGGVVATVDASPADPEAVVEDAPLALVEVDADDVIVRWNAGAEALFGYARAEALGEDLLDLIVPPDERDDVAAVCERALTEPGTLENVNRNVRRDGSVVTCEWHSTSVTDADGAVVGSLSLVHDVTEREARKATIDRLRAVTRDLVRADDAATVAETVVDAAEEILSQPYAVVYLADDDGDLAPAASTADLDDLPPIIEGESVNWAAYVDRETKVVQDDVREHTTVSSETPVESVLVNPLGEHGTLALGSPEPRAFDETDVQFSNILASATTAALDRAQREDELRLQETVVDAVGSGVFALDVDGHVRTANETLAALSGYDRCELVGTHVSELVGADVYEDASDRIREQLAGDDVDDAVMTYEVDLRRADGDTVPCEVSVALLTDAAGYDGVAGVVRDVRERKRIQSELGDKRRKIENLHEVASLLDDCETREAVWELTVEAAEGVLDFDVCGVDEVRGEYLHSVGLSSEIEPQGYKTRAHVSDGIAGKTHRTGESFLFEDVQGDNEATPEKRTYRSLISVPIGDHGVFQAVSDEVGGFDEDDLELAELLLRHVTDAIDRIEFENELRGERDRFAALFENVPDPVVQVTYEDEATVVERVNPAFESVFGYSSAEIEGEDLNEYIVPPDRRGEATSLDDRGRAGDVVEREVKRRTTDGLRDFELTAVPVDPAADEQSTYGVYSDITERKERQKRVEILNRVLRHDLRNGMNIIKGSAQLLRDAVAEEGATRYAEQVIERADDLLGLAEKTRAVERTLDRDTEATGPVDVAECVETSAARIRSEYPTVTLAVDVVDAVPVRADDMLRTAIHHVIENAVEHNDALEPSVAVTVQRAPDREDVLCVRVADDGPGIPEDERELIQEEREITQLRHASGLGLWLVDWVVGQSGGEVTFDANDPRGTVVTLHLPVATDADVVAADD